MNEIYARYRDRMDFYCVYIQEAHPEDGWQVAMNVDDDVIFDQPKTLEEREAMAQVCALRLNMSMPMLLDDLDNTLDTLFAALPERLYVLDAAGTVTFRTVVGSPGFDVDAWETAVRQTYESLPEPSVV
ncbi:MAG: hypothetical protein K0U93_30285 [Gammaproteobacteria bacterium]|nr:hypothetical protein [Gammaproteobacteria bacterium]